MSTSPQTSESFQLSDSAERTRFVLSIMREVSQISDPDELVRAYFKRSLWLFPRDAMISLSRRELEFPEVRITRDTRWQSPPNPWKEKQRLPIIRGGVLADFIYGEEPRVINDYTVSADDPAYSYLEGYRSLVAVPHFHEGLVTNMVVHLWRQAGEFDIERLPDLVLMSNLFGRATQNLILRDEVAQAYREVDREMQVVAEIQRSLLPKELPAVPSLELAAEYRTSRRAGGDYYDLFPLPDGRWGIFIADVAGHGTPAAVMMAITHSIAHSFPGPPAMPGKMLEYLNETLVARYTDELATFITAFYGVYDPVRRTLLYASAGHNPPRCRHCDGKVVPLSGASGVPLGILGGQHYEEASISLCSGNQLLFYTDGIVETFAPDGQMFGYDRLDAIIAREHSSAQSMIDDVLNQVEVFSGGRPAADDRTILAARVR